MADTTSGDTVYRDRATGELRVERVFGGGGLRFLYENRLGRFLLDRVLPHGGASALYGWLKRHASSAEDVRAFVEGLGIDAAEAERPLEEYPTLDAFFTRRLRPGARPIDRARPYLVSPCDARTLAFPRLEGDLTVKRSRVGLAELTGDARLAGRYEGGAALVFRLAPADYHRFHFPDEGLASPWRELGRTLHSVHPIALAAGAPSFANKRHVSTLASPTFGDLLLIEVGALLVGTIEQTYRPGRVERGAEKGTFRFGGSTIVLLAMPGRLELDADLCDATAGGVETLVRVGTRIGREP